MDKSHKAVYTKQLHNMRRAANRGIHDGYGYVDLAYDTRFLLNHNPEAVVAATRTFLENADQGERPIRFAFASAAGEIEFTFPNYRPDYVLEFDIFWQRGRNAGQW